MDGRRPEVGAGQRRFRLGIPPAATPGRARFEWGEQPGQRDEAITLRAARLLQEVHQAREQAVDLREFRRAYPALAARGPELAPRGVTVTLISPGFVTSEIRQVDNRGGWHPHAKDPLPSWLPMPAEVAARKIVSAVHRRRREAIITVHGKILVWLSRFALWVLRFAARRGVRGRSEPDRTGR